MSSPAAARADTRVVIRSMQASSVLRALAGATIALAAACAAAAGEPPSAPILRIETTMHAGLVRRLAVDARHNRLVSAGDDKTIRVWQLPQGRLERVLRFPIGAGYEGRIYALAVSPDGKTIAAGGWTGWEWDEQGAVYLFDTDSGELTRRIGGFADVIGALAYSKDGRHLAVGLHADGGLHVLRTGDYAPVARDAEYRDKILGADFRADGVLAVASLDGQLRLYDPAFKLLGRKRTAPGAKPLTVRFSPDGRQLAVSFHDVSALAVVRAADLALAFSPDTKQLAGHTRLTDVAWSAAGDALYGCGDYAGPGESPILRWRGGGRGAMESLPAARSRIADLQTMPGGGIAFAAEDPAIGVLDGADRRVFFRGPELADFRAGDAALKVSRNGARVQFGLGPVGALPVRFSLFARELLRGPASGTELAGALTLAPEFALAGWQDSASPSLNGVRLALDDYELARTFAISPDRATLVLGTEWALRAYDRDARLRWKAAVPGVVRSIAVAASGDTAVAALADGTIRWYRMEDGVEFLALFPHATGDEWIAWNAEGYYVSSSQGDNYVGWHLNRGKAAAADFHRAVQFERVLYRPDLVDQSFRSRGRAAAPAPRRAAARFDIAELPSITPPRVRVAVVGGPERDGDGRIRAILRLGGEQTSLPMVDHAVFVNDIPVTRAAARPLVADERRRFQREVTVALERGENRVRVEVSNGAAIGLAETYVDVLGAAPPAPAAGDLYLLAVGVNEFPALADSNLAYAARDAEELARVFAEQGPRHFRRVHARTMSDLGAAKPARAQVVEALEFLAGAGPQDTVILFLASHGLSDAGGGYYFVPRDARAEDVAAVVRGTGAEPSSLIGWSVFFDALRRLPGRRILVVDTCHARDAAGRPDVRSLAKRSAASRFALVLAAQGDEASQEYAPARHGLFTYALLEGLRGSADANRDGAVTLAEAFDFAAPVVARLRDPELGPQTPQLVAPASLAAAVLLPAAPRASAAR